MMKKIFIFVFLSFLTMTAVVCAADDNAKYTLTTSYGEITDKIFNDDFILSAEFDNPSSVGVTMYIALYSSDGSLVNIKTASGNGDILTLPVSISDNITKGLYMKAFVMDDNLTPMTMPGKYAGLYKEDETLDDAIGAVLYSINTSLIDDELMDWFASLYDPRTGGFYYSRSARDYEGFLPDLESTWQAISFMQYSGLISGGNSKELPDDVKDGIINFASSMYDSDDGYFYHPQWGRNISNSRRERDKSWARGMITKFEGTYPPVADVKALYSLASVDNSDIFENADTFKAYLDSLPSKYGYNWYAVNNELSAYCDTVREKSNSGTDYYRITQDWLKSAQDSDGLWGGTGDTDAINAAMKASRYFMDSAYPYPNPDTMIASVIRIHGDERPATASALWNPIELMLNAMNSYDGLPNDTRALLNSKLPEFLNRIRKDALSFRRADGGYSYRKDKSQPTSQGAKVSMGFVEGDVNSSILCSVNLIRDAGVLAGREYPLVLKGRHEEFIADMLDNNYPKISEVNILFDSETELALWEIHESEECRVLQADNPVYADDRVMCISDKSISEFARMRFPVILGENEYTSFSWSYDLYIPSESSDVTYEANIGSSNNTLVANFLIESSGDGYNLRYRCTDSGMGNVICRLSYDKWYTITTESIPSDNNISVNVTPAGEAPSVYKIDYYGNVPRANISYIDYTSWSNAVGDIYINNVKIEW